MITRVNNKHDSIAKSGKWNRVEGPERPTYMWILGLQLRHNSRGNGKNIVFKKMMKHLNNMKKMYLNLYLTSFK